VVIPLIQRDIVNNAVLARRQPIWIGATALLIAAALSFLAVYALRILARMVDGAVTGVRVVKGFGQEEQEVKRLEGASKLLYTATLPICRSHRDADLSAPIYRHVGRHHRLPPRSRPPTPPKPTRNQLYS
jgi:hypothetical protein